MPVLLMTDSRGHGLREYLNTEAPNVFRVSARSGDCMTGLFSRAVKKLRYEQYTAVVIMGGICNLTMKDSDTNEVYLRSYDTDIVIEGIRKDIKKGLKRIKKVAPGTPVIIAPTIGLDFAVYNNTPVVDQQQQALDEMVLELNKMLNSCNKKEIRIPWISRTVHHCKGRGRWAHKYQYLRDGCHFNIPLKKIIAKELCRSLLSL